MSSAGARDGSVSRDVPSTAGGERTLSGRGRRGRGVRVSSVVAQEQLFRPVMWKGVRRPLTACQTSGVSVILMINSASPWLEGVMEAPRGADGEQSTLAPTFSHPPSGGPQVISPPPPPSGGVSIHDGRNEPQAALRTVHGAP
ncbi:unnamed protein product [Boreogadus saida]